jgi:hypothetical protein
VLLDVRTAIRFVSCEPLLGSIDLTKLCHDNCLQINALYQHRAFASINWVIAGGESGHHARPMHPDWVRSLRDQCHAANVPFFFKQWGEWLPLEFDVQPPFRFFSDNRFLFDARGIDVIDPETGGPGHYEGCKFMDPMNAIIFNMENGTAQCDFLHRGKEKFSARLDRKAHFEFPTNYKNQTPVL